jgi:hypothetical protein
MLSPLQPNSKSLTGSLKLTPAYRVVVPARHKLAGGYDNPMPESTLSPQSGTMNLATGLELKISRRDIRIQICTVCIVQV